MMLSAPQTSGVSSERLASLVSATCEKEITMFTVSNIKKPGSSTSNLLFRKVPLLTVALVLVAATTHFNDDTALAAGGTPSAGMKNMVGGFLQGVRETLNNIDDVKMFRAQVEVKTANVKYAGTNDDVQVKLNGRNQTWLDHSGNDFERGHGFVYDLNLHNNGAFVGYGPGFWGEGHDPFTADVLGHEEINMTAAIESIGWQTERVIEPAEIIPAMNRAFTANQSDQPAYIEIIASQYPIYGDWAS